MNEIIVSGIPELQKVLDQLDGGDRQNLLRRAVRAATKPFIADMKEVAASSDVPRSFRKIPAARVSTQRGASGREVGATVRPKSPLFNIFEPGASTHTIGGGVERQERAGGGRAGEKVRVRGGRGKRVLGGPIGGAAWEAVGRKRPSDFFATGPVRHPGFKGRDIVARSFSMGEAAASAALAAVILGSAPAGAE
jgi:hypothetical protein